MKLRTKGIHLALVAIITTAAHAGITGKSCGFMDKNQLAAWRAETMSKSIAAEREAAQAAEQKAQAAAPAFFTGKPYLSATATYAFKYRDYAPSLARWTSEDPSGFPDGANSSYYAPCPTSGFDFMGLAAWKIKLFNPSRQSNNIPGNDLGIITTSNYALSYGFEAVKNGAGYEIGGYAVTNVTNFNSSTGTITSTYAAGGQKYGSIFLNSNGYLVGTFPAGSASVLNTATGGIGMKGVGFDGSSRNGTITVSVNASYKGVVTYAPSGLGYTPAPGSRSLIYTHTYTFEAVE